MKTIKIFSALFLIILTGCSTMGTVSPSQFYISVDSIASKSGESGKSYLVLPGNEGEKERDLQFLEFSGYLAKALNAKGYTSAASPEDADLAVFLSYGIGDPRTHHYSYSFPTWGRTGVSSTTSLVATKTGEGKTVYSAYTSYRPNYGITGYETYTGSRVTFSRFIVITAYDYKEFKRTGERVEVWKTTVISNGASDDLRRIFPVMITASESYLGTDTGHKVYVSFNENDGAVRELKDTTD